MIPCIETTISLLVIGLAMFAGFGIIVFDVLIDRKKIKLHRRVEPYIKLEKPIKRQANGLREMELRIAQNRIHAARNKQQAERIRKAVNYYKKNPSAELKRKITLAMEALEINLSGVTT